MGREFNSRHALSLLDSLGIKYGHMKHGPVFKMTDLDDVSVLLGAPFFKNLLICNRQKTEFFLLLLDGDKPFKTSLVSKLLGASRLSFADEDDLKRLLGVQSGGANPISLMFDEQKLVKLAVDSDILRREYVCLHPCTNRESIKIRTVDLMEHVLPATGHEPIVLDIS